jgi:hypothetical protein
MKISISAVIFIASAFEVKRVGIWYLNATKSIATEIFHNRLIW